MGGFGSGGHAGTGSGRKRKTAAQRALTGARDRTPAPVVPVVSEGVVAPITLLADERAVWESLAPEAITAGTLTPATAGAFAMLCQVVAWRAELWARMRADGPMVGDDAHPLQAHDRQYRLREEQLRVRFMLSPVGRPMDTKSAEVDPFAEFETPTHQ